MSSIAQTLMNRSHLIEGTVVVEKCCVDYDQPLPAQRFAVNLEGATVLRVVDSALIGSVLVNKGCPPRTNMVSSSSLPLTFGA